MATPIPPGRIAGERFEAVHGLWVTKGCVTNGKPLYLLVDQEQSIAALPYYKTLVFQGRRVDLWKEDLPEALRAAGFSIQNVREYKGDLFVEFANGDDVSSVYNHFMPRFDKIFRIRLLTRIHMPTLDTEAMLVERALAAVSLSLRISPAGNLVLMIRLASTGFTVQSIAWLWRPKNPTEHYTISRSGCAINVGYFADNVIASPGVSMDPRYPGDEAIERLGIRWWWVKRIVRNLKAGLLKGEHRQGGGRAGMRREFRISLVQCRMSTVLEGSYQSFLSQKKRKAAALVTKVKVQPDDDSAMIERG